LLSVCGAPDLGAHEVSGAFKPSGLNLGYFSERDLTSAYS